MAKRSFWNPTIGSISTGTLRPEDLRDAFLSECQHIRLSKVDRNKVRHIASHEEARACKACDSPEVSDGGGFAGTHNIDIAYARACGGRCADCGMEPDECLRKPCFSLSERIAEDVEELTQILESVAPPYMYFGAHSGDGADFGFWISWDSINEDFSRDSETNIRVDDLSEVPAGFTGEVLLINDHGNTTLYNSTRGRLREVWACV